jgi:enamine deaminase RidA (YjgF/YER057c/UK114 family)
MAANTSPVFPLTPIIGVGNTLLTANTAKDGTGTVSTIYTAGVNGSKLNSVQIAYTGTSTATVLRLFINNGSTPATAGNNSLYMSITVPANTLSEVAAAADITQALSLTLPAGYKLLATIGTTVAAALAVTASGGDL